MAAGAAVLQAADRGYTIEQIVAAVDAATLDADGFVVADGEVVDPEGDPADAITDKAEEPASGDALALIAALGRAQGGDTFTTDDLFEGLEVLQNDIADAQRKAKPDAAERQSDEAAERQADEEHQRSAGRFVMVLILDLLSQGVEPGDAIPAILTGDIDITRCLVAYVSGCVQLGDDPEPEGDADEPADGNDATADGAWGVSFDVVFPAAGEDGGASFAGEGSFDVADDGTISGTASFEIVSRGVCRIDEIDQVEPYRFVGQGSYAITGTRSGDSLDMTWTPTGGSITEREGDESTICVELARDLVEAFFTPVFSLPVTIPAADGTHSTEAVIEDPEDPEDALPLPLEVILDAPED